MHFIPLYDHPGANQIISKEKSLTCLIFFFFKIDINLSSDEEFWGRIYNWHQDSFGKIGQPVHKTLFKLEISFQKFLSYRFDFFPPTSVIKINKQIKRGKYGLEH